MFSSNLEQSVVNCSAIIVSGNTWDEAFENAKSDLKVISSWLNDHMLKLNVSKTKYLTFSPTAVNQPLGKDIKFHNYNGENCNCPNLIREDHVKYLGITIDKHLKWNVHIQNILKSLRKLAYKFVQLRNVVDKRVLRMVYHALVQNILQYGLLSWGGTYLAHLKPLMIQQNNIVRICLKKSIDTKVEAMYEEFSILPIRKLYLKTTLLYIKRNERNWNKIDHMYRTRSVTKENLEVMRINKTFTACHAYYTAPKLFNKMPEQIKKEKNFNRYKKMIAQWIDHLTFDEVELILKQ